MLPAPQGAGPLNLTIVMTSVWIAPKPLDNGLIAVDVNMSNVPEHLFGAAFHLKISGADWTLSGYQLGTVFDGSDPLLLVNEKGDVVVTGISLRREEPAHAQDGKLITFYVQPLEEGEISFQFDYPILSTYENGRKDVEAVEWRGAFLSKSSESEPQNAEAGEKPQVLGFESARTDIFQNDLPVVVVDPVTNVYSFLFMALLLFIALTGCFSVYFWWTRK